MSIFKKILNGSKTSCYRSEYMIQQLTTYGVPVDVLKTIKVEYKFLNTPENLVKFPNNSEELLLLIQPKQEFFDGLNIPIKIQENSPDILKTSFIQNTSKSWSFRTLHPYQTFSLPHTFEYESFVQNDRDEIVWFSFKNAKRKFIVIGTDLAEDLILFRQGDPTQVDSDAPKTAWGFDFERPMYLYEKLFDKDNPWARPVDSWMLLLVKILQTQSKASMHPLLPDNAKGAIILTGDDDQAYLETYEKQLSHIGGTPITYFMHPETRVTRRFLKKFSSQHLIELGLHPDAVYSPNNYKSLCRKQTFWFMRKFLRKPFSVRNHCYLNNGYWGHLLTWQSLDIVFSSNIPGSDG